MGGAAVNKEVKALLTLEKELHILALPWKISTDVFFGCPEGFHLSGKKDIKVEQTSPVNHPLDVF